jgi:hypothetical protein
MELEIIMLSEMSQFYSISCFLSYVESGRERQESKKGTIGDVKAGGGG